MRNLTNYELIMSSVKSEDQTEKAKQINLELGRKVIDIAYAKELDQLKSPSLLSLLLNAGKWLQFIQAIYMVILWAIDEYNKIKR
jgi:hypothetical protein